MSCCGSIGSPMATVSRETHLGQWGRKALRVSLAVILSALAAFGAYSYVADYERLALPEAKMEHAVPAAYRTSGATGQDD